MTRHLPRLTALLLAGLLLNAPVLAEEAKPAGKPAATSLATVNGVAIPKTRAEALLNEQKAQGTPDNPELRAMVREELIRREIMTQEAVKKGLAKKPEVVNQIELARQALLIRAYLQDYIKGHPVTDADIKKEYDGITQAMGDKEYKARHVLVDKEADAKDIVAKLQKGEKFEELAKQSKDPGSKDRGGDLGWAHPSGYVKPFADALVKLEKGKFSAEPVKTDFGYHVILLEDTRPMKQPSLDEVKPQIQQRLQQKVVEKHILELRAKAKVE
ncbi:MAG: peptidylprolyl isomerase [Rhodocyclales bacterium]|nr:peptidylprolyl isomerase [Rhodocyclales bacterium]